jgi:hypothetical protein
LHLLSCWWLAEWSEDGLELDVKYTQGSGALQEVIHVGYGYDPYGMKVEGEEVTQRQGEDIYGRGQNTTVGIISTRHGSKLGPDSVIGSGTFNYPSLAEFEQSWFAREFKITVTCEYNSEGQLQGGVGSETFSGHIMTSSGEITFEGEATGTFAIRNGQLGWTGRTERTNYDFNGKPYAETVTTVSPESEYLGGKWHTVGEAIKTSTNYADGSQRESECIITWNRNEYGVCTGKSGSGTVSGTEILNGQPIDYAGSVTISYGFNSKLGWFKQGYTESRTAQAGLPKRLPFEVIYIDDLYLRPVF